MSHRALTIMTSLAVAVSMTACSSDNSSDDSEDVLSAFVSAADSSIAEESETETEESDPDEELMVEFEGPAMTAMPEYFLTDEQMVSEVNEISSGINAVNKSLVQLLNPNGDEKSGMVSGLSAYSCLASVSEYISGESKEQIDNAVGEMNLSALDYFKTHMPIETGTMFLVDDSTKLNAEKSEKFTFRDLQADDIVDFVNDYVSANTHQLIRSLINEPFGPDNRAVVLDTLYFKGTWENVFEEPRTDKQYFFGRTVDKETDFMHTNYKYGVDVDNNIIELPYDYSVLAMDICFDIGNKSASDALSDYIDNLDTLDNRLCYNYDVALSMPKFEAETTMSITDAYKNLGITNIFDPAYSADFNSLADDIYISGAMQKTKIIVDEKGTEAAAATMIKMDAATAFPQPEILDVVIDEPFVYAIRDTQTNIILFAGYVDDF